MNRRELVLATGAVGAGNVVAAEPDGVPIADDLARYAGFGLKASGGEADQATGAWLEGRLKALGFATTRQAFEVPFFAPETSMLQVGAQALPVRLQAPWRPTGAAGVEGRLVPWPGDRDVRGGIAVISLPFARWSAFKAKEVEPAVRAALAAGAAAVVVVTTGPTQQALGLNVSLDTPPFSAPVVVMAPEAAARVAGAVRAGDAARLVATGAAGRRAAFNVVGRLDRGAPRWMVISTPRSGWFTCAAERGSGVAVWLDMAAWAARSATGVNVLMVSASGHEREYAGAQLFLKSGGAPPPAATALWLHLGANVAARDWHDLTPKLTPLPSSDPQRYLVVQRALLPLARTAFRGQPGLEAPYASDELSDGELGGILAAGYARSAGVFGAHRFHHAPGDDLQCVDTAQVQAAAAGFRTFAAGVLSGPQV